jgi:hypothetical protein
MEHAKLRLILVLIGFLSLAVPCFTQARQCKESPKVVSACYIVHGRASFGSGTPALRIWPVGTKRMLGVTAGPVADDADSPICPKKMLQFTAGSEKIFSDFEVCPFTPKKEGAMQMVCVESASHLVVKRYGADQK